MSVRNQLTHEERRFISIALAGASNEIVELVRIIERLSGEEITPADENKDTKDWGRPFDPWKDRQR